MRSVRQMECPILLEKPEEQRRTDALVPVHERMILDIEEMVAQNLRGPGAELRAALGVDPSR